MWRKINIVYYFEYIIFIVIYGGGSIMFWGCFFLVGIGKLVRVDGKMDGVKYRVILEENFLEFVKDLRLGRRFIF